MRQGCWIASGLALLLAALSPAVLQADEGEGDAARSTPPTGLTLEQVEQFALSHNPSLQQAAAIVQKGLGTRRQVGRWANPSIAYQGQQIGDEGTAGQQGVMLQQTFVLGGKLELNERIADWEVQALRWQAEAQRYRVRNDVRRQFYIALGAQQRVLLVSELRRIAEDGVRNAQTLQEALIAARPDVLQTEIQLREVEVIHQNARYQQDATWKQLAALMGAPRMAPAALAGHLDTEEIPRDEATARQQLLALSPQLQQARAEAQRASARIRREQAQPIPNVQVQLGAMHMHTNGDDVAGVQIALPIPLFNTNDGNISRADADYQRTCWNVRRLELALQSQLAATFQAYQDAANRVRIYRDEIVPRQSETLRLIESAYPEQFDFLRLLTARQSYYQSQLSYLQALVDLRTAEVSLDGLLLTGGLDDLADSTLDDGIRGSALNGM